MDLKGQRPSRLEDLITSNMELHPHEIKVLKSLKKESSPEEISKSSGLELDAVMRASAWLSTKELVKVDDEIIERVTLTEEGKRYVKTGLPERRILDAIDKEGNINDLKIEKAETNIGLGWLRKKGQATLDKGIIKVLNRIKTSDEEVLELLDKKGEITASSLNDKLKMGLDFLRSRKNVIAIKEQKIITLIPTEKGIKLAKTLKEDDRISQLTPHIIKSGSWAEKGLRPYDTDVFVKPEYPVKEHPLMRAIEDIREIFLEMGFSEIRGPLVESAFWNFDALFTAQDHPVRDMQDTFYLKQPKSTDIPGFERLKDKVRKTHEDGWTTGSCGWRYKWDESIAKKTVLRTHTTALTAKYLANIKESDLPVKVFSLGKVFRNEAVDYKHLPEFYQVEGIVADKGATFRHLLGVLKEFYDRMGFKVRFRPAYFPYTEMSVEPEIYFEEKGEWIELGGAGIFRPEVVKPLLGFDCPVLAWGLGVDRIVTLKLGLKDIRELYISSIDWLKKARIL